MPNGTVSHQTYSSLVQTNHASTSALTIGDSHRPVWEHAVRFDGEDLSIQQQWQLSDLRWTTSWCLSGMLGLQRPLSVCPSWGTKTEARMPSRQAAKLRSSSRWPSGWWRSHTLTPEKKFAAVICNASNHHEIKKSTRWPKCQSMSTWVTNWYTYYPFGSSFKVIKK